MAFRRPSGFSKKARSFRSILELSWTATAATRPLLFRWARSTRKRRDCSKVTEDSLLAAIAVVKPGATLGDVGFAVQKVVEAEGFSVVRDFVGHGIGSHMHEDPQVPNFGVAGRGMKLRAGMVIAIEPMVNAGKHDVVVLGDGWTAVTADGSMSAHFEHTVAVTATGARILTE